MRVARVLSPLALVTIVVVGSGSDCAPDLPIAEAADCCECLASTRSDGEAVGFGDSNCLPDDDQTTRGVASAEEQACSAGAGEAINSDHEVYVVPVCLQPPHPCADSCGRANASRPIFVDAT